MSNTLPEILTTLYLGKNFTEKQPNWRAQMANPELQQAQERIYEAGMEILKDEEYIVSHAEQRKAWAVFCGKEKEG